MPRFSVKYKFTCPICVKHTDGVVNIDAADAVEAREFAVASAGCEYCHQQPPEGTFVGTEVDEIP
jgi:hypothetical protein